MALSVKNDEADRLARDLARLTGESLTETVLTSLRERLERERDRRRVARRLSRLVEEVAAYPILDDRTPDQILGYDQVGLPE